tara:strand:+ start:147 stop:836 length:690 start_codon:yes stop_codon:yes gene_type:complete
LKERHQQNNDKQINFYTALGTHVYIKNPIVNDNIDVENVIDTVESMIPAHLLSEVEMIIVGWFKEFEERSINAFYADGALCISNIQDDESDMVDDIIHEISHAAEEVYGYEIYADNLVKEEFLRKRKYLHDILWQKGYKAPETFFMDLDFDQEFDDFLYKDIGYAKLSPMIGGLFLTPYAATSLREYFATGFTEYYMNPDQRDYLSKLCPSLYKKILLISSTKELDTGL